MSSVRWLTVSFCLLCLVGVVVSSCGSPIDDIDVTVREPVEKQFLRGVVGVEIKVSSPKLVKEILAQVVALPDNDPLIRPRLLGRKEGEPFYLDWDTARDKDGVYRLEVQVLLHDGRVLLRTVEPLWIVNQTARLRFPNCLNQPLVARDEVELKIEWLDFSTLLPSTPIDFFVQGTLLSRLEEGPYVLKVDLSKYKHGEEIYISAVAAKGIFRGATTVCSVHIDRLGPRLRFVYPSQEGSTVPVKFSANLEIEDEFGIQKVEVKVGEKIVGQVDKPPFQIPVDLTGNTHNGRVTLTASAIDKAGNITKDPPSIEVVVDAKPPEVQIVLPQTNAAYSGEVKFQAKVWDDAGVGRVDFYLENENGQRIDNILHTTGEKHQGSLFETSIPAGVSLYGAGKRKLVVVATDINQNQTIVKRLFILGCKTASECPANDPPYQCLGHSCIIPHKLGDPCEHESSCESPLVCYRGGTAWCAKVKIGICRQPCDTSACPNGYFCLPQKSGKPVCFPSDPCSPFTLNCEKGQQCVPWGKASFVCLPIGGGGRGTSCTPYSCSSTRGCRDGYGCVPIGNGSQGRCYKLCDQDFPRRDCGTLGCVNFPLQDKNRNSMGYCQ